MSARLLGLGFGCDMGTPHRKLVLLKLIDACEDDGSRIFPAVATIARAAQCSARQVQRELSTFVRVGLLSIVREGGKGPRSTREYQMDVGMLRRIEEAGWETVTAANKGDRESPLDSDKGDSDDTIRVTGTTDKGDKLSHPTPQEPSIDPSEEREARGRADDFGSEEGGSDAAAGRGETPGTADFEKRVMRFCNGRGFTAGAWPDWDTSAPGWIGRQFTKLSESDRQAAERWRDAYLRDIALRRKSPVTVGVFLRDRLWEGLDPEMLLRADRAATQGARPAEPAKPDGWAPALGPVWAAALHAALLDGPERPELAPAGGLWLAGHLRRAWPAVAMLLDLVSQGRGLVFGPRWHALRDAMEFVPTGTAVFEAWVDEYRRRGWPEVKLRAGIDGAYFPKGGPAGLDAFGAAVQEAGNGDDRDAAE